MQLAACRSQGSTTRRRQGNEDSRREGVEQCVAPSALLYDGYPMPKLSIDGIQNIVSAFAAAARRAVKQASK